MATPRTSGRKPGRQAFPVVVTKLPVVRCQLCRTELAYRPTDQAGDVLTHHYEREHPTALPK